MIRAPDPVQRFIRQALVARDDAQFRPYTPLRSNPALYLELADTPPTLEGILSFANRYGLLGITDSIHNPATVTPAPGVSGGECRQVESFETWKIEMVWLREAVRIWGLIEEGDDEEL